MVEQLTERKVIDEGGWHPRYAHVLLILEISDEAIVLVDGNGDGAEIEWEQWFFTEAGWRVAGTNGIGPFDHRPLWTWGTLSGTGYVVGCADPGQSVTVEWMGESRAATINELGIWVSLFPRLTPGMGGDRPYVVVSR